MQEDNLSATQSINFGTRLRQIKDPSMLPTAWRDSPIEEFIGAHNFGKAIESGSEPRLLIVSCIEFRFRPEIPNNFAYVIRSAGGRMSNLPASEFALAYILAKGVRHVALVGHNDCGMTRVNQFRPNLAEALVEQGWDRKHAEDFIRHNAERFAIEDEIDSLETEYLRLKELFKNIEIAPLFVSLASTRLHIPKWYQP